LAERALSQNAISTALGQKRISGRLRTTVRKLLDDQLVEWTIPDIPNSRNQQYRLTLKGRQFLELLEQAKKKK
jgi:ATP-dependent DNA helicase RecG